MSPPSTEQKSKDEERVIVKSAKVVVDTVSTQDTQVSRSNDHIGASVPTSRMAWYLLIFVSLWLFNAMAATTIIFCYTSNSISLSFFTTAAPPFSSCSALLKPYSHQGGMKLRSPWQNSTKKGDILLRVKTEDNLVNLSLNMKK
jgi:hypothetical protein